MRLASPHLPFCLLIAAGFAQLFAQPGPATPPTIKTAPPAAVCTPDTPTSASPSLLLLSCTPALVSEPLDLAGFHAARLPLLSIRGLSWTGLRFSAYGANLTDPYQPGRAWTLPLPSTSEFEVLDAPSLAAPTAEIRYSLSESSPAWRTRLNLTGTSGALSASNLPPPRARGLLQQPERFHRLAYSGISASGPLSRSADLTLSAALRWASQTVPQAAPGNDLHTRVLPLSARLGLRLNPQDRISLHAGASRYRLSDFGLPAGIEVLLARRMSPDYFLPTWGFSGLPEFDRFGSARAAWLRSSAGLSFEIACAHSRFVSDTLPAVAASSPARIDYAAGVLPGPAPLAGYATRARTECSAVFDPRPTPRHRLRVSAAWDRSSIGNQLQIPANRHLLFTASTPAFVVQFHPTDAARYVLQTWTASALDSIQLAPRLQLELTLRAEFQSARLAAPPRSRLAWPQLSPRLAAVVNPILRLTLRAAYALSPLPVAGRYLDYAGGPGLHGAVSFWQDNDANAQWQPSETGPTVLRFGSLYSALDPTLRSPLAREIHLAAQAALPLNLHASLTLFRQTLARRIAAVNVGLPPQSFQPVAVNDPGPDGLPGTPDDLALPLYAQLPATFNQDRYRLTNPPGLNMTSQGLLAELRFDRPLLSWRASFLAVKALGPTNPGNSAFENDPGVLGSLLMDPNTTVHASGRTFFDRAYAGKTLLLLRLPPRRSGLEFASSTVYLDGLAFGRRLLVTSLPQGPFLASATVRGSPEGGHRTQYVFHWNLRIARTIPHRRSTVRPSLDLMNVLNRAYKLRELDLTGPRFYERLPVAIQPPRSLRLNMEVVF
ncbi:MAG: TonB-dependent receptor [Bryobacteraceae bacterium]|nr:TonB-dependent receptor [Bryobacteraceae bacterium]